MYIVPLAGAAANAEKISAAVDFVLRPAGLDFENSMETKLARSFDNSKMDLYISCSSMLPRRMSKMTTIAGFTAAMYV